MVSVRGESCMYRQAQRASGSSHWQPPFVHTSNLIRTISPHSLIIDISDLAFLGSSEWERSLGAADIEGAGDDGFHGFLWCYGRH